MVLDASAILALLFAEPGAEVVAEAIADGAVLSTVNLSEVAKVLVTVGDDPGAVLRSLCDQVQVEPFTVEDALLAAALDPSTRRAGLSLGDRACLALARRLDAVALTAEHAWAGLDLGIEIELLRQRG